jgi:Uma2 family endonuclease
MSALRKTIFTIEEYFALAEASLEKLEYVDGEIYAMAGASPEHSWIHSSLHYHLYEGTRRKKCRLMTSDTRIKISPTRYVYPDMVMVCGKPQFDNGKPPSLLNPTLIVEVLSSSTKDYDRSTKFGFYQTVPSFQEYLLVHQDIHRIEHYVRIEGAQWLYTDVTGDDTRLTVKQIDTVLRVGDVYEQLDFEE